MFVELDVALAHAFSILVRNLRHHLSGLVHEVVFDEPLAHELLRELLLRFALCQLLLIAVGIEITAGVGGVNLVNEIDLTIALTEFIFGIYEDKSLLLGNLLTACEELAGIVFHHGIVFSAHNALGNDFLLRDVQVVTLVGFGGRSDDGLWETLVLLHTLRQFHATQFATSVLVFAPCAARQDAADNHLYAESLALQAYGHHRVGGSQFPVGADVAGSIQELCSNLVQHLSLEGNALWQDDVEGRDAVGSHHHHQVVVDIIHVTYFTVVNTLLTLKIEVSLC